MGAVASIQTSKSNSVNPCTLCCNNKYEIISVCDVHGLLEYETHELIGESITILMTDIVKQIHKPIFKSLQTKNIEDINKLIGLSMDNIRTMTIVTKSNKHINCYLDVTLNKTYESTIKIREIHTIHDPTCPKDFLKYINGKNEYNVHTYDNVICIMMDMANSTYYTASHTSCDTSLLYFRIMRIVDNILQDYSPYVYIHETVGDAIFILVNTPFVRRHNKPYELAINVSKTLVSNINNFLSEYDNIYFRCGISCGTITAGVIDGRNFRVFGSVVNKASRLESRCEKGKILIDETIYDELNTQNQCLEHEIYLKGFGNCRVYSLNITD